jgi:hypothetical protein
MTITIELPDDELFKVALKFQALAWGYRSIEDCCADGVVGFIESEERFDSPLAKLCHRWQKRYEQQSALN